MSLKHLEKNGEVVLKRFNGHFRLPSYVNPEWIDAHQSHLKTAIVIDLETTGLDSNQDKIIEVGVRQFKFDRRTGDIVHFGDSYNALQDPQVELSKEISDLTGLTNEMLRGQKIDWNEVTEYFQAADVIIAHNAEFERSFLDHQISISNAKIWACSLKLINWNAKGFNTQKLEVLNYYHGYYVDSHRAMNDVDALTHLLSFSDEHIKKPYLLELLEAAKQPRAKIVVLGSPFETKDLLKSRGYRWDTQSRNWYKSMPQVATQDEVKWIEEFIYQGPFVGTIQPIRLCDNFKN